MIIRCYGKTELAQLFYPNVAPSTARKNFNVELRANRKLWATLKRQGYRPNNHQFTIRQVRTIFMVLDAPFD